ncbi:MAG: hypothetical protein NC131_10230 [Roseburia sp.]|nr:hypothetical protein [Roseburia sp.]
MNYEDKIKILNEIENKADMFRKLSPIQYRIRCPICGDSQKNIRDAHCYIKCSYDPSEPLQYNCFLCNSKGRIGKYFLEKLGIKNELVSKVESERYNKLLIFKEGKEFDEAKPIMDSVQIKYIENRLGKGLTENDYEKFRIVWDMNIVSQICSSNKVRNKLPANWNTISFLSDDRSLLISRTFIAGKNQWIKNRLFPMPNRPFYTIKTTLQLFTEDRIVVNIAEGIFDILSVYKNFNDCENSVFIATLGSDYIGGVEYAIAKGFVCSNVELRIYMDQDKDEKILKKQLKDYKWIFGSIIIYRNISSKDVGVTIDNIQLSEIKV